jgi:hypothetical protein
MRLAKVAAALRSTSSGSSLITAASHTAVQIEPTARS